MHIPFDDSEINCESIVFESHTLSLCEPHNSSSGMYTIKRKASNATHLLCGTLFFPLRDQCLVMALLFFTHLYGLLVKRVLITRL